ncbi:MAG: PEP-utilizing enzyme, partial [Acidimicrobiales bacterium]
PALAERAGDGPTTPLPSLFRLSADGHVVPVVAPGPSTGGRGASGGRAVGFVHGDGAPSAGAVLVVATLDPALATVLPHLGAIVSESGSVLSHLAILAREFGVPAVVGVSDAVRRFPPGSRVTVDGTTGEVSVVEQAPEAPAPVAVDLRGAA